MKIITAYNSDKFGFSDGAWSQIGRASKGLRLAQSEKEIDMYNESMYILKIVEKTEPKVETEAMVDPYVDPYAADAYGERSLGNKYTKTFVVTLRGKIYLPTGFSISDVKNDIETEYHEHIFSLNAEIDDELRREHYSDINIGILQFDYEAIKGDAAVTEEILAMIVLEVSGTKTDSDD